MARQIVKTLFCGRQSLDQKLKFPNFLSKYQTRTAPESRVVNMEAKGRVKPSRRAAAEHTATPDRIYGLRRPNRDFEWSARTPKYNLNGTLQLAGEEVLHVPMSG